MKAGDHPWEESRGMGFSYGYNRAERLQHYHTGRQLVILLADIVSRGGNLLLDIGPDADGTIPVVMEDRLVEIGSWLATNGEAIYGTTPFAPAKQWSEGQVPKIDYDKEFESSYDVAQLALAPAPGQARIEAFFTAKGGDLYAILPRWPGRRFTVREVGGISVKTAVLLGHGEALRFSRGPAGLSVELPELPEGLLRQPAFVLKLSPR
jgi:alpha-L-fucosidase